jgi:hypothetical protein
VAFRSAIPTDPEMEERMRNFSCLIVAVLASAALACGRRGAPPVASATPPKFGDARIDRPFVVFNQRSFVIDHVGVPMRPPVSIGSRPSPETIASDDCSVVQVDATGALVGLRNGRVVVRSRGGEGSSLDVEVKAVSGIALSPPQLVLEPGGSSALIVTAADGSGEVGPAAVTWGTSAPSVVSVLDGRIQAIRPGSARIVATYGGATAAADIMVRAPAEAPIRVEPSRARMRVGDVWVFQAIAGSQSVRAQWKVADARVLRPVQDGLVQARRRGRSQVCATVDERTVCSQVEVSP